jgi:hypothetical protein
MPVTSDEQLTEMVLRIMRKQLKQLEDKMHGKSERLAAHLATAAEREERRQ